MDIYEVSKQQLTKIGGDATNLSTTYEVKKAQVDKLGGDLTKVNDIYTAELEVLDKIGSGGDTPANIVEISLEDFYALVTKQKDTLYLIKSE